METNAKAIPLEPPSIKKNSRKRKRNEIQSQLMLATDWNKENDPTNWYLIFIIYFVNFYFLFIYLFNLFFLFLFSVIITYLFVIYLLYLILYLNILFILLLYF